MRIVSFASRPLQIPLRDPFVIATGRVDATRAALVEAVVEDGGARATGIGEAAALHPVTKEDLPDLLVALSRAADRVVGASIDDVSSLGPLLDAALGEAPVARAGAETALLDAIARLRGVPASALLGPGSASSFVTDVTIPIAPPDAMARTAAAWRARGFTCFKVKVGKSRADDQAALAAIQAAVPDATFRIDANAGFTPAEALALLDEVLSRGLVVECYEQPCGKHDLDGMAEVTAKSPVPVVADESVATVADLERCVARRALHGVNLKLVKAGGLVEAYRVGRRARELSLSVMVGAMVESRLGLTAMAHVARALGGVDWVDLDTALLLADDPFVGGYDGDGPRMTMRGGAGLDVSLRS